MIVAVVLALAASGSTPPRPVVPEDTYLFRTISALEVSPDGRTIVYGIEIADEEQDSFRRELWLTDAEGRNGRRVCPRERECTHPRFSRDGKKLAWIEDRDEASQLVVATAAGRRARAVTRGTEDVGDFDWSPDGKFLVFERMDPYVATPAPGAPRPATSQGSGKRSGPHVITRTQIQLDGAGFLDGRRTHLYVVPATGGDARRITDGPYDEGNPRWSPRGDAIAFVSNRNVDPDTTDDTDIYRVSPAGGPARKLAGNPGPDLNPSWSHAGDRVAFVGQLRPNDYYQTTRLMVVAAAGGDAMDLSGKLDAWVAFDDVVSGAYAPAPPQWSSDDATIFVPFARRGGTWLAAVPSDGGEFEEILAGALNHGRVRLAASTQRVYYTRSTPTVVSDLWMAGLDGSDPRKLVGPNDATMGRLRLATPAKLLARSRDGTSVESWLYPPLDLDSSKRYPMIVYIHGGPQEYDGDFFDTGLENQLFPGEGWGVLRVNYRGSTSYGETFSRALWADWHVREYEDLTAAVDQALAENPWIDPERLGIGGWSFGGIMTIWTVGHTSRFKVGVPERFEIDYLSCFGSDQWQAQYVTELGDPFENEELYRRKSPGTYVTSITTPLYLIANENDRNCPPSQAMQLYQRLKLRGVPTELVSYPGEPHSMTKPSHYVDRLYRLVDWFGRHLE